MERHQLQQALLARGIRVAGDDPLFLLLEINEIHFDAIAAKHFHTVNQHVVAEVISKVLERQVPRQPQQTRCTSDVAIGRAAAHLESVAATFSKYEERMAEVARVAADQASRAIVERKLTLLSREVNATLARFEKYNDQAATIVDHSNKMINAARIIHSSSARVTKWWIGTIILATVALILGLVAGRSLTANAFNKVQAACISAQIK